MQKQFECQCCRGAYDAPDCLNKESLVNQLKKQQSEIERSCDFIDELREKISRLEQCFNYLSSEKKSLEIETNKKISHLTSKVMKLQSEKEQIASKYSSTKQKVKSMLTAHRAEVEMYRAENSRLQKEKEDLGNDIKDFIIENDRLIAQVNYYYTQRGSMNDNQSHRLEEDPHEEPSMNRAINEGMNSSIEKLNSYIKNLEQRNEALTKELDTHLHLSRDNKNYEVIIGLKRVISEKERTINTLYNNYDKLNIKLEDETLKNDKLLSQIEMFRSQLGNKTFADNNNSSNPFINQY